MITKIGDYELQSGIGEGAFATVRLATHCVTNTCVAVKIISKGNFCDPDLESRFQREVDLMKNLDHPFISTFFEVLEDSENYYVVMEYVSNGNLLEYVNTNGELSEDRARHYFCQLISVLDYLHNKMNIAHRDLKAENVLLDRNDNIRVIDFGLSNAFSKENPFLKTVCGSPAYAAPEMIKGEPYTNASDIWSLGILLYAIVLGELPFDDDNQQRMLQKIVNTEPDYPSKISVPLRDLLKRLLAKDPASRITLEKIRAHPWFSQFEYSRFMGPFDSVASKYLIISRLSASDEVVDREIVEQMGAYGYDCQSLVESILSNDFSKVPAVYKMLKKDKITDIMENLSLGRGNSGGLGVHEPRNSTACPKFRPIRPPIPVPSSESQSRSPRVKPRETPMGRARNSFRGGSMKFDSSPVVMGNGGDAPQPLGLMDLNAGNRKGTKVVTPMLQRKRSNSMSLGKNLESS